MSTTTQILFNSPALHSLKRDQLVKLCKIHSLRANGKNKELIERLQLHAKTLPPSDPLSVAARSDNPDAKPAPDSEDETSNHSPQVQATASINISRPSEQWSMVMDTITEVDEETLRSNRGASDRQAGEFGTTTSKGTVTSSLRAIATSLGLKRNPSKTVGTTSPSSSLSSKEAVPSSSTLPTSDTNGPEVLPIEPIPGQSNLPGFPAPVGGRLSLTQAPTTTTIRLISNPSTNPELVLSPPKLKPFATSFDLVPGTPGGPGTSTVPVWPLSPSSAARESLYPPIPTFDDLMTQSTPRSAQYDNSDMDLDVDIIPGGLAVPSIHVPTLAKARTIGRFNTGATPKSSEKPSADPPDIFSPGPKPEHSSTDSRLDVPKSKPFVFGSPLPQNNKSNIQFRTAAQSILDEMNKRLAVEGVDAVDVDVLNNRQTTADESAEKREGNSRACVGDMFDKIHQKEFDKMDSITSHYAAKRGIQSTAAQPILSKKRKSSLVVKERQTGAPVARHRLNGLRTASGASMKTLPGDFGEEGDEEDDVADRRMSKRPRVEREESDVPAQSEKTPLPPPHDPEEEGRKQKEREAIRRRLDHNKAKRRSSMGRPSLGRAPPPKPTRFGFLATAKSLVQNVWNRGAGSKASSSIPRPAQPKEETKVPTKATEAKKTAAIAGSSGAPPFGSQTKFIPSGGSGNSSYAPGRALLSPPSMSGSNGGPAASDRNQKLSTTSSTSANPKSTTIAGYTQSNHRGNFVGFSSLGAKKSLKHTTPISSMGATSRISGSTTSLQKPTTGVRVRTMSTLMAPTASSLAKTTHLARSPASAHDENATARMGASGKPRLATPQPSGTMAQITNSPPGRPGKVFSQPLSPSPARPAMSLTAAAAHIVGAHTAMAKTGPPKTKVLPGRRPRISRSKVIARLASQRETVGSGRGSASGSGTSGGKVRSSMSAEVAGKARQSYSGARGSVLMSAKKRVRQSEQARRRSRMVGSDREGANMDVD